MCHAHIHAKIPSVAASQISPSLLLEYLNDDSGYIVHAKYEKSISDHEWNHKYGETEIWKVNAGSSGVNWTIRKLAMWLKPGAVVILWVLKTPEDHDDAQIDSSEDQRQAKIDPLLQSQRNHRYSNCHVQKRCYPLVYIPIWAQVPCKLHSLHHGTLAPPNHVNNGDVELQ